MLRFENIEFLWLLILLVPLIYIMKSKSGDFENLFSKRVLERVQVRNFSLSKRTKNVLILSSMLLTILALSRPQMDKGEIEVKSSFVNIVVAIDMSKSMFANDIYPNRFEFAKQKFFSSLDYFKHTKIALIGFSSQTFLISPLTEDFHSLKFLAQNLSLESLTLKGTDILATLKSANELFGEEKQKVLLLFTDGGDETDFSREIAYAKTHNIAIYIYNIGTSKGGVIQTPNGVLKDKKGDIVIVKRNDKIQELALQTGGAYMKYSLAKDDIKLLVETIESRYKAENEEVSTIKDRRELFYYPTILAIVLLFVALFSLPNFKRSRN